MLQSYAAIALLSLALCTSAVDVRLFETSANCMGDDFISCTNQPAGQCCFGADLYKSCDAINPQKAIQAFSRQGGEICGVLLGGSFLCWGVSNDIASISGCKWSEPAVKKREATAQVCSGTVSYVTHVGKVIDNKSYMISMDRPEYQIYRSLNSSEDRAIYIKDHADIIKAEEME
ncbi:Nn.00g024160.m01.CDS01 [Neocucurbitaria sp. VM-36]